MAHYAGIDPDAEPVIRRAVGWHVHNDRAEIEATRDILIALVKAGYAVIKAENGGAQR